MRASACTDIMGLMASTNLDVSSTLVPGQNQEGHLCDGALSESLPADSKLLCMDLEATWHLGFDGQSTQENPTTGTEVGEASPDLAGTYAMDTWESASDTQRSGERTDAEAALAESQVGLEELASGTGSRSQSAGDVAVAAPIASTMFEGSSSHDSWSAVPMSNAMADLG